ncbi:uncharacterized protein LOC144308469 isoform X2 [Canis aureus]
MLIYSNLGWYYPHFTSEESEAQIGACPWLSAWCQQNTFQDPQQRRQHLYAPFSAFFRAVELASFPEVFRMASGTGCGMYSCRFLWHFSSDVCFFSLFVVD